MEDIDAKRTNFVVEKYKLIIEDNYILLQKLSHWPIKNGPCIQSSKSKFLHFSFYISQFPKGLGTRALAFIFFNFFFLFFSSLSTIYVKKPSLVETESRCQNRDSDCSLTYWRFPFFFRVKNFPYSRSDFGAYSS